LYNFFIKYYTPDGNNAMPVITTENCSDYLLLYIDNELSPTERILVEQYMHNNAFAKELYEDLLNTVQLNDETKEVDKLQLFQYSNINLQNFEEQLILGFDNELSTAEQKDVKNFAIANNLNTTYQNFENLKYLPDTNTLIDKNTILKFNNNNFNANTTIAEALLLKLDNQLESKQNTEVDNFINTNNDVAAYYTSLENTKLEKETFVFPNKERLYKKDRKPIFYLPVWSKIAAVLIIAFSLSYLFLNNKKQNVEGVIVKTNNNPTQQLPAIDSNTKIDIENTIAEQPLATFKNNFQEVKKINTNKQIVNIALKQKETVTSQKQQRTIKDNAPEIALSNNDNNYNLPTNNISIASIVQAQPANEQSVSNVSANALVKQSSIVANYIVVKQIVEANDVSIFNIPVSKIDKGNKIASTTNTLKGKIAKKINAVQSKGIKIAGYEIGVVKLRK
jgi:hypothetical protein